MSMTNIFFFCERMTNIYCIHFIIFKSDWVHAKLKLGLIWAPSKIMFDKDWVGSRARSYWTERALVLTLNIQLKK